MNKLQKRSNADPGCELIAARQPNAETEEATPDKSRPRRMLNEKQVLEIVPVGRTTLYRMEKAGRFRALLYSVSYFERYVCHFIPCRPPQWAASFISNHACDVAHCAGFRPPG
jgi:hypothetical protein